MLLDLPLYLFALLTSSDRIICDLWTKAITREALLSACGTVAVGAYRLDVYDLEMQFQCSRDGSSIGSILEDCALDGALDDYVLRMVQRVDRDLICIVESASQTAPTSAEIAAQCPAALKQPYTIEPLGSKPAETPAWSCPPRILSIGSGLYDQASSASAITTDNELAMLKNKLIWTGIVTRAESDDRVRLWQNQFDQDIFSAAITYAVPARLLKKIIETESQFYPFWETPYGETSIMQITDNGLDVLLRYDPDLDPQYLSRSPLDQMWTRATIRDGLTCHACTMDAALNNIRADMPTYARILAAFQCRAVTINPALTPADSWRQAVVDFNGSAEYLRRIER